MITKNTSSVAYAVYKCGSDSINKINFYKNNTGYLYYKIVDANMLSAISEFEEKIRENEEIVLDIIKYNHIYSQLKRLCQQEREI